MSQDQPPTPKKSPERLREALHDATEKLKALNPSPVGSANILNTHLGHIEEFAHKTREGAPNNPGMQVTRTFRMLEDVYRDDFAALEQIKVYRKLVGEYARKRL